MTYPPVNSQLPELMVQAMLPLEARAREVVIYAEETEPWPKQYGTVQFMDCNLSMQFLSGSADRNIFTEHCPTIAASSNIWVRVQVSESLKKWALLPGWMLMRLIGYPGEPEDMEDSKLMSSFAGTVVQHSRSALCSWAMLRRFLTPGCRSGHGTGSSGSTVDTRASPFPLTAWHCAVFEVSASSFVMKIHRWSRFGSQF